MRWIMTTVRALLAAMFLACASSAVATTASDNYSDLWWIPNESGWGANVSQQADVMFVTLFVYGPTLQPVWYGATLFLQGTAGDGSVLFSGDLYQTTGPYFGTPSFNPGAVVPRRVGTASFQATSIGTATLQYAVDGTVITKQIQRQLLRANSIAGTYLGGTSDRTFNCSNPAQNDLLSEDAGTISIAQAGSSVTITAPTCTFIGTYVQQGQTGRIDGGTYTCTNGARGNVAFTGIYTEQSGLIGKYTGRDSACEFSGNLGGVRRH